MSIHFINLLDDTDRLGSNLARYISVILVAIKHNYKINFVKPKHEYSCYDSIFVEALFNFVDHYNNKFGNAEEEENTLITNSEFFQKMIKSVIYIQSDFISAFKEHIFTEKFKENLSELAERKNYFVPYNVEKTIVVHLRLDDVRDKYIDSNRRCNCSMNFRNIIDNDDINYTFPGWAGQSAMREEEIGMVIDKALSIYNEYDVIIITNGEHTLPYKTIHSNDYSYDFYLLCNSKVLIGSMSTFSLASMFFGNHNKVYYPLWDHAVFFGLTTKYDKTNNIELF
jgi:hypothetical protein